MRALLLAAAAAAAVALAPAAPAEIAPVRWCGNDRAASDRVRDLLGGPQIHVVYAIPSDGEDRFTEMASLLTTDVAAIDAWWRASDPTRAPRFDLFAFPGCESRMGLLDLSFVRLPQPGGAFASSSGRFEALADALSEPPFDFDEFEKKYLIFYDGVVESDNVCGTASGIPNIGGAFSYAIIYTRSTCGATVGGGRGNAYVAAHELMHTLGALDTPTPNECDDAPGHVCDGSQDVLWPFYAVDDLTEAVLDLNRDDYYGHAAPWFDVQDSRWLLNPLAQFPVTLRVVGSGIIGTEPDGQGCTSVCVTEWDGGDSIQIAADPAAGFGFAGWGGACAGPREPSCLLDVRGPAEVVAMFRPLHALNVAITGRGSVSVGTTARCTRSCRTQQLENARVTLRAQAIRGWRFVRWTGGCTGRRVTCVVRIAGARRVTAVFARRA
jgi:hypothetical protein